MTLSENQSGMRRHDHVWRFVPLVLWIGVIFLLSSSQGSFTETSRIIRPLLEFLFPTASPEAITFYHGVIRKIAHFTEYAMLGFLAMRAFAAGRAVLASSVILIAVATIDEINQSFNPARTGAVMDVLIDLAGGAAAILVIRLRRRPKP